MLILVNRDYGGYDVPTEEIQKKFPSFEGERDNQEVNKYLLAHKYILENSCDVEVVEIPDEATDYDIFDYDGAETLIYVIDGKLYQK